MSMHYIILFMRCDISSDSNICTIVPSHAPGVAPAARIGPCGRCFHRRSFRSFSSKTPRIGLQRDARHMRVLSLLGPAAALLQSTCDTMRIFRRLSLWYRM